MQSYGFRASRLAYIHEKKYFRIRKNVIWPAPLRSVPAAGKADSF